jgi:hypothetical protein
MYLLSDDGVSEWSRDWDKNWPLGPLIFPGGGEQLRQKMKSSSMRSGEARA